MANRFDVVSVRTSDERCIVIRVVLRTQSSCTIVFATGRQSCAIERVDLRATLGCERKVEVRWVLLLDSADAQRGFAVRPAKLDTEWPLGNHVYAERFERLEEERLARRIVSHSEYDVVKHEFSCAVEA